MSNVILKPQEHSQKCTEKVKKIFKPSMDNVVSMAMNFAKNLAFCVPVLAVLGLQGVVVKCTATIFSVQWILSNVGGSNV